ncbi:MAG: alpha/beta hydrolase [Actinomycetota bacterium]|nr:alpha/beta hydrolase [Actinomycetota bacterium]
MRLFYTDEGEGGPPILFVHGYSCDSHDWSWQIPHFVEHHRVIAMDNRGHGRSSVPDTGYDHGDFAADTAGLIDHLGCGPVVAIGHSLGGVIVSTLAIERPDLVRAVVSVDPGYLVPDAMGQALGPVIEALQAEDPAPAAQAMLSATYSPASPMPLRTWHMRRTAGVAPHVLRQTLGNLLTGMALESNSAPYLAQRKCPVLTMYTDPARAALEASLMSDDRSRAVSFEGSGHWLHQERPAEFNHLVDSWLATLDAG